MACRQIRDADLPAVVDLLREGFPDRTLDYWRNGLRRLAAHASPDGLPRFGHALVAGGATVGVMLLIHAHGPDGGGLRANVSSWYVRPAYRPYASLLNQTAVKNSAVTYVNISPSLNTLPTIEALGFTKAHGGLFVGAPALAALRPEVAVTVVSERSRQSDAVSPADARLLAAHAGFGCLCLWVETPDGGYPFIFRKRLLRLGSLPCAMLVYCRSLETLERFAGPIGRTLARRGLPFMLAGADRPLRGVIGKHFPAKLPIYCKGGAPPRNGDLSYTEAALFGM